MPKHEGDIRQVRGKIYSIAGIPTRSVEIDFDDSEEIELNYVNISGDLMEGFLTLNADPVLSGHAVTKNYVDLAISGASVPGNFVNVSGDTMTGFLTLNNEPVLDLHAATKKYVDDSVIAASGAVTGNFVNTTGDTMTGTLDIISGSISIKTHDGFPGTEYREETKAMQTADNSFMPMQVLPIDEGYAYWFESTVIARKIIPSTPTKILLEINRGCVYRDVGGSAILATTIDNALTRSVGAITYDVEVVVSGNNLVTTINGDGAETVNWTGVLKYQKIG